ncbi:MAG: endonuclease/exonuclease/phosphatase family protein [Lutibacter sp.]|uniref:endonuclease/exonuclease/phosphatase family protein n=1 Tax=Lutibacter sp. TaxID=1925666 RepID=UPI0017A673EC|nr:endonuclease/exonuclease/phosphatase family protein [Lutibacter sp.]MBT8318181.1 endonuclease/exonuclease/phosphatase family protein [Lutibacter sp.]NNJ59041.1 endonuclease/exonuclease/phosphatase family protein [Lutibacter sp.]
MKRFSLLILFLISTNLLFSQKNFQIKTIAFYNLENLFDTINDPTKNDEASPIMEIKENRSSVYKQKLNNMAKVLSELGTKEAKNSPIILGVAEVENLTVLEDLINTSYLKDKQYSIIHYDSPDLRGIDVALLYQSSYFKPTHHETFELKLWDENGMRIYTRDQLLVSGYLDDELIHVIVNHWPSRRGGEEKSRSSREKAAYLNTQIIEKIKLSDPNPKVIIMGDLNDDPTNSSVKNVLKTKAIKANVKEGDIYNPTEDMFRRGQNTLVYRDNINLFDQIMFTSPLLTTKKDYSTYKMYKVNIFNPQYLTTQTGKFKRYPYRSFAGSNFIGGYSDHYPIYMYLIKEQ